MGHVEPLGVGNVVYLGGGGGYMGATLNSSNCSNGCILFYINYTVLKLI